MKYGEHLPALEMDIKVHLLLVLHVLYIYTVYSEIMCYKTWDFPSFFICVHPKKTIIISQSLAQGQSMGSIGCSVPFFWLLLYCNNTFIADRGLEQGLMFICKCNPSMERAIQNVYFTQFCLPKCIIGGRPNYFPDAFGYVGTQRILFIY